MTLNPQEIKIVVSTLSTRRSWIKKTLEDNTVDAKARKNNTETLQLLESAIQKLSNSATSKPKNTSAAKKVSSIGEARVLVAEDDEVSAELMLSILEDIGVKTVDHAKDGMEAFDHIKRAEPPYHIILCDWDMPELSGIDVHNKAKASKTLRGSHFVMVTAVSEANRIKQAGQQGISDYIVKPIEHEAIEAKIKTVLGLTDS